MTRHTHPRTVAFLCSIACCSHAGAQSFEPFASASGTVTSEGEWAFVSPDPDGTVLRSEPFVLGADGSLTFNTGEEAGHPGVPSVSFDSVWTQRRDQIVIESPPYSETRAHEWEFGFDISGNQLLSGKTTMTIEIELLQPARVTMRARTTSHFDADLGALDAWFDFSISGFAGMVGTMAPDRFIQSTAVLGAGTHQLTFEALPYYYQGSYTPHESSMLLRFEPVTCLPDLNGDGILDFGDIGVFVTAFLAGC